MKTQITLIFILGFCMGFFSPVPLNSSLTLPALTRHQNDEELPVLVKETMEETYCGLWVRHIVQHLSIEPEEVVFQAHSFKA